MLAPVVGKHPVDILLGEAAVGSGDNSGAGAGSDSGSVGIGIGIGMAIAFTLETRQLGTRQIERPHHLGSFLERPQANYTRPPLLRSAASRTAANGRVRLIPSDDGASAPTEFKKPVAAA
jgi:hypothetical protein